MGQVNNVHIIDIYARGTIDERILDCLNRKENLVERFKGEIEKQKDIREWLCDPHRLKPARKTKSAG